MVEVVKSALAGRARAGETPAIQRGVQALGAGRGGPAHGAGGDRRAFAQGEAVQLAS
jgi:hypothetical protein